MKRAELWVLGMLAAGCSTPAEQLTDVPQKHQHDEAYQRQVQLLQAEEVTLGAAHPVENGTSFYVLHVQVLNPKNQPEAPDSLRQRVRRLARVVVADLASPAHFSAVSVQVRYKKGFFLTPSIVSQTFIYPLASLQ